MQRFSTAPQKSVTTTQVRYLSVGRVVTQKLIFVVLCVLHFDEVDSLNQTSAKRDLFVFTTTASAANPQLKSSFICSVLRAHFSTERIFIHIVPEFIIKPQVCKMFQEKHSALWMKNNYLMNVEWQVKNKQDFHGETVSEAPVYETIIL